MKRAEINLILENYEESVRDYERVKQLDPTTSGLKEKLKHAQIELKKSKRKDYYKILNVTKDADDDQIKKAYKKQALLWHPDKHSNSTDDQKL